MITVKRLKELLAQLPDDATVHAYEGEGIGLVILADRSNRSKGWWITATDTDQEDEQDEFFEDLRAGVGD